MSLELEATFLDEERDNSLEFFKISRVDITSVSDSLEESRVVGSDVLEEFLLELENFGSNENIEISLDTSEDNANLLLSLHGGVLVLLKHFNESFTSVQELLGGSIEIRTELREGSKFSVLGESVLEGTSESLHGLDLSG